MNAKKDPSMQKSAGSMFQEKEPECVESKGIIQLAVLLEKQEGQCVS